jgi:hypothetical protein
MIGRLALAALLLGLAAPAQATESIVCASDDQAASIDMLVGLGLDVVAIDRVSIEAGGKNWATNAEGDSKIAIGQAFEDDEKLIADFTDDGISKIVASVRLYKASEGEFFAQGGTLKIAGAGAWAVTCSGP